MLDIIIIFFLFFVLVFLVFLLLLILLGVLFLLVCVIFLVLVIVFAGALLGRARGLGLAIVIVFGSRAAIAAVLLGMRDFLLLVLVLLVREVGGRGVEVVVVRLGIAGKLEGRVGRHCCGVDRIWSSFQELGKLKVADR